MPGGQRRDRLSLRSPVEARFSTFYGYAKRDEDPNDNVDNRFERFYGFGRPWSANDYIVFENINARRNSASNSRRRKTARRFRLQLVRPRQRHRPLQRDQDPRRDRSQRRRGRERVRHPRPLAGHEEARSIIGYAHFTTRETSSATPSGPNDTDFAYLELNLTFF